MDSDVELSGWVWKFSVVGKNDWKPQHWRKRFATVSKSALCFYKDPADSVPSALVNLKGTQPLTVYSTQQNDFPFSEDGYNYFMGIQFYEEGKSVPLLLLLKCITQQEHQTWSHHFSTHMESEQFNYIKKNFPTFDASALEKAAKAETQAEASSSDDEEAREMIASFMSDQPAKESSSRTPATTAQAQLEAAKKRLQASRARAEDRQPASSSSNLKEKLAALKAKNKEASIARPFLEATTDEDTTRRERRKSLIEDIPATPVLAQTEGSSMAGRSKLEKVLAQQRSRTAEDDIAKKIQNFAARLDKDFDDDEEEEEATGLVATDPAALTLSSSALTTSTSEKRAKLLAKAKQAKAKKMSEIAVQTDPTSDTGGGSADLEEKYHDAAARAQAAEAEVESIIEETTKEKEQLKMARQRCQSLIAERDSFMEKATTMEKEASEQMQKVKDRLSEVVDEKDTLKRSLQEAGSRSAELEAQLQETVASVEGKGDELNEFRKQIEAEKRDREARITVLEKDLASRTVELEQISAELATSNQQRGDATDEFEELKRQLQEAEAASAAKVQEVQKNCNQELAVLKEQLEATNRELADEAQQRRQAEENGSAKNEALQEADNKLEAARQELSTAMEAAQTANKVAEGKLQTISVLEDRLKETTDEIAKLSEGSDQAQVLSAKLDAVITERDTFKATLGDVQQQLQVAESGLQESETEQQKVGSRCEELEAKLAAAQSSLQEVSEENRKAKAELLETHNEALKSLVAATGRTVEQVASSSIDDATKQQFAAELDDINAAADKCKTEEERAAVSAQVTQLQEEIKAMKPQLSKETQDVIAEAEMEAGVFGDDVEGWKEVAKRLLREKNDLLLQVTGWTCPSCSEHNDSDCDICRSCSTEKPLETEEAKTKRELLEKTEELSKFSNEVDRLSAQVKTSEDACEALKETLRTSQEGHTTAQALEETDNLKEALEHAEKQRQELLEREERLNEQLENQAKQLEALEENASAGKEVARKLLQAKCALEEELEQAKATQDTQGKEGQEDEADKEGNQQLLAEIETLSKQLADASEERNRLKEAAEESAKELEKLRESDGAAEGNMKRAEELQQELSSVQEDVAALRVNEQSAKQSIEAMEDLSDELSKLKAAHEALQEASEAQKKELEGQLQSTTEELTSIRETNAEGDATGKEVARGLLQEITALREQLSEMGDALEASKEVARKLINERTDLQEQLEESKEMAEQLQQTESTTEAGKEVARQLLQDKNRLQAELEDTQKSLRAAEQSMEEANARCEELEAASPIKGQAQQMEQGTIAVRDATIKAAETSLDNPDLTPEEREELETKVAALKEMELDDEAMEEVCAKAAELQESVERVNPNADTNEATLQRSFNEASQEGTQEEVWKEVSRRLLQEKGALQTEVSGLQSSLEVAKSEVVEKDTECQKLQQQISESGAAGDELAAERMKEMQINMMNLNDSISELEEALLKERRRGDDAADELKSAALVAEQERDALLVKLSSDMPDDKKAEALQNLISNKLLDDSDLSEEQRQHLQELTEMPLSDDPEELNQQVQQLREAVSNANIDDTTSEAWKEVARRLLQEKRELQDALSAVKATQGALDLLPEDVREQVQQVGEDTDLKKAQGLQAALKEVESDPAAAQLQQNERGELVRASNIELSNDPDELHKQLEDLQSVATSVRHSSVFSSLPPELQKGEDEESWKDVARRLLMEKKELQEALSAVNSSEAVTVLPPEVREQVQRLADENADYVPAPTDAQKAEDLQEVLREALCTPAAADLDPKQLEALQVLSNKEVTEETGHLQLEELQSAAASLMDSKAAEDLPVDLKQDLSDAADKWKEVSRTILQDKKELQDELDAVRAKLAACEEELEMYKKKQASAEEMTEPAEGAEQQQEIEELQHTLTTVSASPALEQLPEEQKQRLSRAASMIISEDPKTKQEQLEELQGVAVDLMTSGTAQNLSQEDVNDFTQTADSWKEVSRRLLGDKRDLSETVEKLQQRVEELEGLIAQTESNNGELQRQVAQLEDGKEALQHEASLMEERASQMEEKASQMEERASVMEERVEEMQQKADDMFTEKETLDLQQTLRSITTSVGEKLPDKQLQEIAKLTEMEISKDPEEQRQQLEELQNAAVAIHETVPELQEALINNDAWKDVARRLLQENHALKEQLAALNPEPSEEDMKTEMLEALLDVKEGLPLRLKERIDHLSVHPDETSAEELAGIINEITTTPQNLTPEQIERLRAVIAIKPDKDVEGTPASDEELLKQQVARLKEVMTHVTKLDALPQDMRQDIERAVGGFDLRQNAENMKSALVEVKESECSELMTPRLIEQLASSVLEPLSDDRAELQQQHHELFNTVCAVLDSDVADSLPADLLAKLRQTVAICTDADEDSEALQQQVDELLQALAAVQESAAAPQLPENLQQMLKNVKELGASPKRLRRTPLIIPSSGDAQPVPHHEFRNLLNEILNEPSAQHLPLPLLTKLGTLAEGDTSQLASEVQSLQKTLSKCDSKYDPSGLVRATPSTNPLQLAEQLHELREMIISVPPSEVSVLPQVREKCETALDELKARTASHVSVSEAPASEVPQEWGSAAPTTESLELSKVRIQQLETEVKELEAQLEATHNREVAGKLLPMMSSVRWLQVPEETRHAIERLMQAGSEEDIKEAIALSSELPGLRVDTDKGILECVSELSKQVPAPARSTEADSLQQALACALASPSAQQLTEEKRQQIESLINDDAANPEVQAALKEISNELLSSNLSLPSEVLSGLNGEMTTWKDLHKKFLNDKAVSEKVIARSRAGSLTASTIRECEALQQAFCAVLCSPAAEMLPAGQKKAFTQLVDVEAESVDVAKLRTTAATMLTHAAAAKLTPRERECLQFGQQNDLWKFIIKRLQNERQALETTAAMLPESVESKQLQEALAAWSVLPSSEGNGCLEDVEKLVMLGDAAPIDELRKAVVMIKSSPDYDGQPKELDSSMKLTESWKGVTATLMKDQKEAEETLTRERANSKIETEQCIKALRGSLEAVLINCSDQLPAQQMAEITALLQEEGNEHKTPQDLVADLSVAGQSLILEDDGLAKALNKAPSDTWKDVARKVLEEKKELENEFESLRTQNAALKQPATAIPSDSGLSDISALLEEKQDLEHKVTELRAALDDKGTQWYDVAMQLTNEKKELEAQMAASVTEETAGRRKQMQDVLKQVAESPVSRALPDDHRHHVERLAREGSDIVTLSEAVATVRASPQVVSALPQETQRKLKEATASVSPMRCKDRVTELEGSIHDLLGTISELEGELDKDRHYNAVVDIQETLLKASQLESLSPDVCEKLTELATMDIYTEPQALQQQLAVLQEMAKEVSTVGGLPEELRSALEFLANNDESPIHEQVAGLRKALEAASSVQSAPFAERTAYNQAMTAVVEQCELPDDLKSYITNLTEGKAPAGSVPAVDPMWRSERDSIADLEALLREKDRVIGGLEHELDTISTVSPPGHNPALRKAAALRDGLVTVLESDAEIAPALRSQIQALVTRNLNTMTNEELHAAAGSLRAVSDAVLTTGVLPIKVRDALARGITPVQSIAPPIAPQPPTPPRPAPKPRVEFSDRQSLTTGTGTTATTESDLDFMEKLSSKIQVYEAAVKSVLDCSAARYLTPTLHYQLSSLAKRPSGNFVQAIASESAEEVVALRLRVAELEGQAQTLEGHSKRSEDMIKKLKDLSRIPGMPEESRREIHTAIASDAALTAASNAAVRQPDERVCDLETQVSELTDALTAVMECQAAEQLPESLHQRILTLSRSKKGQIPLTDHYRELQDVAVAVQSNTASDMFPEWLIRRLDRLIQESSNEKTELLLRTMERLENKIQRLEGSKGRVDNLVDSVKNIRVAGSAVIPEEAKRAMDTLIIADVAAAQRLLLEAETASAASVSASAGEAGAAALAALLRIIEGRLGTSEGSAVQLAEASTAASGLCNASGVVGLAMNAVASLTHDALSCMRAASGLPDAVDMVASARKVAEAGAATSSAARFISTALSVGAHTDKLVANDLNVFANRLYSESKDLPNECHPQVLKLTKDLRHAASEGLSKDTLLALSKDASAIAGYEQAAVRPRFTPATESAAELRNRAVELRASGGLATAATVDRVAQMLETGDTSVLWDAGDNKPTFVHTAHTTANVNEAADQLSSSWTSIDPSVAKVVRQALKKEGGLPADARSYLADTLRTSQGKVGPLAEAADSILERNDLGEDSRRWVEDLVTAADSKARDLMGGLCSLLRSKMVTGDAAVLLSNAVAEADQQLRTLLDLAFKALDTPTGIPEHVYSALSEVLGETNSSLQTAAAMAVKDPGLAEQTRRVLKTSLRTGSGIDVGLEAALACTGLSRGVRRVLQEALAAHRTPIAGMAQQPLLPASHVILPHAVRRAELGSLPPSTAVLSAALRTAVNRAVTLERAIDSVLMLPSTPGAVREHLRHLIPSDADAHNDQTDFFSPTEASDLTQPGVREGLTAILRSTGTEDIPPGLRHRLEGLAGIKPEVTEVKSQGKPQVVVLENPGAGEWLDCQMESRLPNGRCRIRVLALPPTHPAVRFSGKHLAVDEEHLRYKKDAVAKPPLGTVVRRNPASWKWGEQDGGAGRTGIVVDVNESNWIGVQWESGRRSRYRWGKDDCYDVVAEERPVLHAGTRVTPIDSNKQGSVVVVDDGWATVKWDTGTGGRYRWGEGGEYDLKLCASEGPDEDGLRAAVRSAVGSPDGDSLSDIARLRLESLVGPGSPHRKVTRDIQRIVDEIHGQTAQHNEPAHEFLRAHDVQLQEGSQHTAVAVHVPTTRIPSDDAGSVNEWVKEAVELLREIGEGVVEARGQQWVLLTPDLAARVRAFNTRPQPESSMELPVVLKGLLNPDETGVNVMEALKEVLDSRDLQLAQQIRGLAGGTVVSSGAPLETRVSHVEQVSVGVQCAPTTRCKGVNVNLTESLHKKLNSEREKIKGLQVELVETSNRRSRSVDREKIDVDPDPENDAWVDSVVANTKQDPAMRGLLPNNFGRDVTGGVRFGNRKIDLVAINEFAAVRIGGGYMLFSDFVKKYAN